MVNEKVNTIPSRQTNASTTGDGQTATIRLSFPFPVKQVGPKTVEIMVQGTAERPLTSTCFSRLADEVGERDALRIERKVANLLLREEIAYSLIIES